MTLIIAFLLAVCLPLETSLAKKPPKPPPDPDPPPVQYSIQFFYGPPGSLYAPGVIDMNNFGCVVGRFSTSEGGHGFVYYPNSGEAIDLNEIVSGLPDDDGDDVPDWHIRSATAINDSGDIVGSIVPNDNPDGLRSACFIDMNAIPRPALEVIPLPGTQTSATEINSTGDIVGYFTSDGFGWGTGFLYNPGGYVDEYGLPVEGYGPVEFDFTQLDPPAFRIGQFLSVNDRLFGAGFQIAGAYYVDVGDPYERYPFRWDIGISSNGDPDVSAIPLTLELGDERRSLGHLGTANINNAGVVLGKAVIRVGKGNKQQWRIFRHDGINPGYLSGPGSPRMINDAGDFITFTIGPHWYFRIYLDEPLATPDGDPLPPGFFDPVELIDFEADPEAAVIWFSSTGYHLGALNNGIDKRFGQIAGYLDGDPRAFVLTPDR